MARKPTHYREEVKKITDPSFNLKLNIIDDFEKALQRRDKSANRLPTDNDLYIPFIDAFVFCAVGSPLVSVIKDIGVHISDSIYQYELKNKVEINKQDFFYAMAAMSIQQNDDVNAMIYWEMANIEYSKTNKGVASPNLVLSEFKEKFSQVYAPMEQGYNNNAYISKCRAKYTFIKDFDSIVTSLPNIDQLHFISNAVRNRKTQEWLRQHSDATMVRIYCQELVNSLVIQSESLLKENPSVHQPEFGKILKRDIINVNTSIDRYINDPAIGLFIRYPIKSIPLFNAHFLNYLTDLESNATEEEFKAKIIYLTYRLRNQVLHQFDDTIAYYLDKDHFEKVIGILFISLSAILSL